MRIKELTNALEKMETDFLQIALDTLMVEFSIVDADDNVLFWNKHGIRVFKRGPAIIGRNARLCHPKDSVHKVDYVLRALKSGEKDHIDFWLDLPDGDTPRKMLVRYSAIRDEEGKYLGTLESSINLTPLQAITGENRLGDFD